MMKLHEVYMANGQASMDYKIPSIANGTSMIADALRECFLNLNIFSKNDQEYLFELDDIWLSIRQFWLFGN